MLGVHTHCSVAIVDQRLRVAALNAAIAALLVGHVHAQAGKTIVAQRQAEVGCNVVELAVIGLGQDACLGFY